MTKGKLFVISGPSGTGKGTICSEILDQRPSIRMSVSMTTRTPRNGEIDKIHYHFTDHDSFRNLIEADGFLEYANVYGNFYGTPRKQVMEWLDEGIDVILEIDVQGAMQVRNSYPDAVLIFILPPSLEELRNRIAGRGSETEETMKKRLGAALNEISQIGEYDYSVVNDDIDIAVDKVKSIIVSEQCRVDCENVELTVDKYKEEL